MTTMTGLLGLTDNSNGFAVYKSKAVTLAAGESYGYTFVNYNKGTSGTDEWENWAVEATNGTKYLDFRADGGYWGELPSTVSYTGSTWTAISSTKTTWLQAYNGVTVSVTVSRSVDGATFTVSHTATTNVVDDVASTTYTGTYTATIDASATITFYLTNEDSHLIINKVIYTDASGEITNYELKNIDLSAFDANCTYADGTASFILGSGKWSKLDLSSYYSSISGTITDINMKFTENIGTGGRMCFGIFGSNKTTWSNGMPETANSVSTWGICGSSNPNRVYYGSGNVYTLTVGSSVAIEVDMDMINKKFTFIQAGTTLVNNQSFYDSEITSPQYFAGHTWTTEKNTTTLTDMTMEVVYLSATYYTATFTNSTSGNTVSATIYSDSERTSSVTNGMLENGKTYYFTATETGYQDYNGEFTVSGSDPSVSFAMTAKSTFTYTKRAVYGSNVLNATLATGTAYEGETVTLSWSKYINVEDQWYVATGNTFQSSATATATEDVEYTTSDIAYFFEAESLSTSRSGFPTASSSNYSGGSARRNYASGQMWTSTIEDGGVFTLTFPYSMANASESTIVIKTRDSSGNYTATDLSLTTKSAGTFSEVITIPAGSSVAICNETTYNSNILIDYLTLTPVTVSATIASSGYTTLASAYALNFSDVDGLTAYVVSNITKDAVTISSVNEMPANSGIVLKGTAGTSYSIPAISTASFSGTNKLQAAVTATEVADGSAYILKGGKFCLLTGTSTAADRTIPAGKAYLLASDVPSTARNLDFMFGDEETDISAISRDMLNGDFYNLQGQRVAAPKNGLYIVNGKKVIVK